MKILADSTVLIVDDAVENRFLLSRLLAEYHTLEADSGEEALQIVAERPPDIILLDIQMPGLDGFEVCRRLKASPHSADIPVIFITANTAPGVAGKCLQIGAVDFVSKPFDLQEIKARVKTHLALRQTSAALSQQNRLLEARIKEQRLNSQLARQVLELIDVPFNRNIILDDDKHYLVVQIMACACNDEGGDHHLIKTVKQPDESSKTLVSLKDQSGHSVNCILRSIITDLFHNSILHTNPSLSLRENITLLNNTICSTGLFAGDDFFTALFLEIDHGTKRLDFVAAGHPSFFLIRAGKVQRLPEVNGEGANLPLGFQEDLLFHSATLQLLEGDRLLLFTDGLTEIPMSWEHKALPTGELLSIVQEMLDAEAEITISTLTRRLPAAIRQKAGGADGDMFPGNLHDDVTIVGLELTSIAGGHWQSFVPADFAGIDGLVAAVFAFACKVVAAKGFEIDDYKMRIALTEGIINAWKHGNNSDGEKTIRVGWHVGNDFCLLIKDQGAGFDYARLKNPILPGKRLGESGRGIFCMKKYADCVGWQDGGSTLLLFFRTAAHPWEQVDRAPGAVFDLWNNPLPGL